MARIILRPPAQSISFVMGKALNTSQVTHLERDSSGELVARRTPSLLARLIARSAGQTLPAPKRGRGRPPKSVDVVQVAADIWDGVTGGGWRRFGEW